ncbi:glycoside hydrolase family 3 C-terminal domain-containing protein [Aspergillus ambiguus]|uniref:glycoside hydrolase family 3 C-terminal domain-containing protein n=1 Tax=Aspergillus ambiguus TaxID=176160 RepID=UPI003CCE4FBB
MAWYRGRENGNALADVLTDKHNFSGKTPITFARRLEDHGSHAWLPGEASNDHCTFGEGVLVGYRHFDAHAISPLWPFGFGLSYTLFELSDIRLVERGTVGNGAVATVHARVENVGQRDGQEVVQGYTSSPRRSVRREAGSL